MALIRRFDARLSAELKSQKRPITKGLACVAVTSLLTTTTIPLIRGCVNAIQSAAEISDPNRLGAVHQLGVFGLLIVALYAAKYWFTRGQTYYLSYAATKLANDLRIRMFAKLPRLPVSYFNEKRTGALQSVLTNDVNVYQTAVTIIRDSIDGPLKAIGSFIWIFVLHWQLGLVALLFLPPMAIVIQMNSRKMRAAQSQVQDDLAELSAMSQESLQGARVIKAFNAESRVRDNFARLAEKSLRSTMAAVKRLATLRPLVEFVGATALATVLYICGWLSYRGILHVGDIAALIYALDVINQGARNLGSVNNTYAQVQAASDRIYREVLDVPEEHLESRGNKVPESVRGAIEFRHVSFVYPDGTEALNDVSFSIKPGTSLAIVGPSGSGKSTIADLMLRFYDPTEGQILFDGVDIRELPVDWLRGQIGVVPQQIFLFAGPIAENIRLGKPDATDDEVFEAATAAHADVFVLQMPNKYQTKLGERGIRLSGGEMQRIAIARAVIRKPAVLLLDEATSSLDAHSEKAVQQALDEIMRHRTTLFIAHRLTTASRADRILVLRKGEVLEVGSHKELIAATGAYAGMIRAFNSGVLDSV